MKRKTETTITLTREEVSALLVRALKGKRVTKDATCTFLVAPNNGGFQGVTFRMGRESEEIALDLEDDKPVSFNGTPRPAGLSAV